MEGEGGGDREKETCILARGCKKKQKKKSSVRKIGTYTAYSEKHSAGINGVQMDARAHASTVHTYTQAKKTHATPLLPLPLLSSRHFPPLTQCDALHLQQGFPQGYTPLRAVFLTLLSHFFIHYLFFFPSQPPSSPPFRIKAEPSWSKRDKYLISYIRSSRAARNRQR